MEGEEVRNGPIQDAVDGVADRAADDEANGDCGEARGDVGEPKTEREARDEGEGDERPAAEVSLLCQEAVTDALIPDEDEIEEGCDGDNAARADVIDVDQALLA